MEQSNGYNVVRGCAWSTGLTQDERDVVELLLEMRGVMLDLEADLRIPFQWGRKRKRSAIQLPVLPRFSSSSQQTLPPPPLNNGGCDGGKGVVAAVVVKGEASSPATPLSLSLTESDEKPNNPLRTKASLKRKREYYLKIIEDLTKSQASLNQEIDNVMRYYGQLKAFNLKLKERREELSNGPKSECRNPSLEIGCQTQRLLHAPVNSFNSTAQNQHHNNKHHQLQFQVPNTPHYIRLRLNNTSGPPQLGGSEGLAQFQHVSSKPKTLLPMPPSSSSSSPSGASLTMVNNSSSSGNMGPKGVPDLNASPEEFIQVDSYQLLDVNVTVASKDLSRAMAAQARQRRLQINRLKYPIGNSKPRFSCR